MCKSLYYDQYLGLAQQTGNACKQDVSSVLWYNLTFTV